MSDRTILRPDTCVLSVLKDINGVYRVGWTAHGRIMFHSCVSEDELEDVVTSGVNVVLSDKNQ